jgi:hypothetical protein
MLSRRTLRAMRDRWERDLERLETAYGLHLGGLEANGDDNTETARGLLTAIAHIEGMISQSRPTDAGRRALSEGDRHA